MGGRFTGPRPLRAGFDRRRSTGISRPYSNPPLSTTLVLCHSLILGLSVESFIGCDSTTADIEPKSFSCDTEPAQSPVVVLCQAAKTIVTAKWALLRHG